MSKRNDDVEEVEGEEVVISEMTTGEESRVIRVYDHARGDFELTIPAKSTITFSYFNPAASGDRMPNDYGGRGGNSLKMTALRIYQTSGKSSQLACFLGVDGFRDKALTITRLRQRVVIESNFEDDGEGNTTGHREQRKQLVKVIEDEESPF